MLATLLTQLLRRSAVFKDTHLGILSGILKMLRNIKVPARLIKHTHECIIREGKHCVFKDAVKRKCTFPHICLRQHLIPSQPSLAKTLQLPRLKCPDLLGFDAQMWTSPVNVSKIQIFSLEIQQAPVSILNKITMAQVENKQGLFGKAERRTKVWQHNLDLQSWLWINHKTSGTCKSSSRPQWPFGSN